jgi:hypothetical protein
MAINITVSLWWNHGEPDENAFPDAPHLGKNPHPETAMKHMGISYREAVPSPISDTWRFWGCSNVPEGPYPRWMTVTETSDEPTALRQE